MLLIRVFFYFFGCDCGCCWTTWRVKLVCEGGSTEIFGATLGLLWSVLAENHPDFINRECDPFLCYFYSVMETFLELPF